MQTDQMDVLWPNPVDLVDGLAWLDVARPTPFAEFGDIHAAVAGFAVVDPGLRPFEELADLSLGEFGFLAQQTEKRRDCSVVFLVLCLCSHKASHFHRELS